MLIPHKGIRFKIYKIIFHADTPAGKLFDIILFGLIIVSTAVIMLDSIQYYHFRYGNLYLSIEWVISVLFSIEFFLRLFVLKNKKAYIFSTMGIIDLLSIVPFYLSIFLPETQYFVVIRLLRLLRVFRVLNMLDYMNDSKFITKALVHSSRKIYMFLLFIGIFVMLIGSLMYVVEKGQNGFSSIPESIYWAVVTVTTVGFGDITPMTPLGKFLSTVLMLCGYSIIAVPTGIVTAEMQQQQKRYKECERCGRKNEAEARYCIQCGEKYRDA